jgi:SPP1 gp7 family putative phage head morphogenesis protein
MYDYADKVVIYLISQIIDKINKLHIDDYTAQAIVFKKVRAVFDEINELVVLWFVITASQAYDVAGGLESTISKQWLIENVLEAYDPITQYVYTNEFERKADRFAESLVATNGSAEAKEIAVKQLTAMIKQYSITVVDMATLEAYIERDVEEVVWHTVLDRNTCSVCRSRHGMVYPVDKVPPKVHYGCRCYLVPKGAQE